MRRIAICAPATPIKRRLAQRVAALAAQDHPQLELSFHEQCFASEGHFAGPDAVRLAALLECANDPGFDAVWFAKGGYGSNRIARDALAGMNEHAREQELSGLFGLRHVAGRALSRWDRAAGARAHAGRSQTRGR